MSRTPHTPDPTTLSERVADHAAALSDLIAGAGRSDDIFSAGAPATGLDLVFWDPSTYRFNSASDWNQWRYIPDGLGGQIGVRFSVAPGFGTWNWDSFGGKAPAGSIGDATGTTSFGKNQMAGFTSASVNGIRMQTNTQFTGAHHNYIVELDFSQYKGSAAGGKDGVAGANTFFGVSDIYAGLTYAKTVVSVTGTLADGSAASPSGWQVFNGGAVGAFGTGNQPSAQLGLDKGVLQGTSTPAPGGTPNSIDTVMGLVRLDAAGYKTLRLSYDIYPVGGNRSPRTDFSALYVATAFPRQPAQPADPPKADPPKADPPKADLPKADPPSQPAKPAKECDLPEGAAPVKPTVVISDSNKKPGASTSYTFAVRGPDGSVTGKGCFTYTTPADGGEPQLSAFYYHDKVSGTVTQSDVQTFHFSQDEPRRFAFVGRTPARGVCSLHVDTTLPAQLTGIGGEGPAFYLDKTLEGPTPTTVTKESDVVPAVDLVVVIDSSVSMKDEAEALSQAVSAAIESARKNCPSDLRVTYLGIEGTFKNTKFDTTVKNYLVGTARADESALHGRKKGTVAGGGAQEDGARAIEDVTLHFDWRADARRAIFFLGDEAFEGGELDVDQEDIDAANRSIAAAKQGGVRVHTYLGTSSAKEKQRKPLESEYARVASETGGQAFTHKDALGGFQALLEKVICGSKVSTTETSDFCCCQQYVEEP
ncbi:VWA domain-containing protein [Nannocystis punicea]|uniref:VWA domain-containing protein n=1 Tax=Nannocystis punicea TaxID=2995304 RepID=A0ABY7GX51_9BACT|nr:VWA domain-containing protein [Nannocystis poenicansa]WAS91518.1 VWA domain-containing protein [Nannocystis poenicansa]